MGITLKEEIEAARRAKELDEATAVKIVQTAFRGMVQETDILNAYLVRIMRENKICTYHDPEAMRKAEDLGLPRRCGLMIAAIDAFVEKMIKESPQL